MKKPPDISGGFFVYRILQFLARTLEELPEEHDFQSGNAKNWQENEISGKGKRRTAGRTRFPIRDCLEPAEEHDFHSGITKNCREKKFSNQELGRTGKGRRAKRSNH